MADVFLAVVLIAIGSVIAIFGWLYLRLNRAARLSLPANTRALEPALVPITETDTVLVWAPEQPPSLMYQISLYHLLKTIDGRVVGSLQFPETDWKKRKNAVAQSAEGSWYFEQPTRGNSITVYAGSQVAGELSQRAFKDAVFRLADGGEFRFRSQMKLLSSIRSITAEDGAVIAEVERAQVTIKAPAFKLVSLLVLLEWYRRQLAQLASSE